jgi:hypothetical protein
MTTPAPRLHRPDPPVAPADEPEHWLRKPRTVRHLWIVFGVILTTTVAAQVRIHLHGTFGLEETFGFNAWYGLGTCILMVVGAKALGLIISRKDTYYAPPRQEDRP